MHKVCVRTCTSRVDATSVCTAHGPGVRDYQHEPWLCHIDSESSKVCRETKTEHKGGKSGE